MAAPLPPPPDPDRAVARRAAFRDSVAALSTKARNGDLTRLILLPGAFLLILGFNFVFFGWWGAAHTARQIEQIPYLISGGLIGVSLIFIGGLLLASALWMVMLRQTIEHAEQRGRDRLFEELTEIEPEPFAPVAPPIAVLPPPPAPTRVPRKATRLPAEG